MAVGEDAKGRATQVRDILTESMVDYLAPQVTSTGGEVTIIVNVAAPTAEAAVEYGVSVVGQALAKRVTVVSSSALP